MFKMTRRGWLLIASWTAAGLLILALCAVALNGSREDNPRSAVETGDWGGQVPGHSGAIAPGQVQPAARGARFERLLADERRAFSYGSPQALGAAVPSPAVRLAGRAIDTSRSSERGWGKSDPASLGQVRVPAFGQALTVRNTRLYLIQFEGPVRDAWKKAVVAGGGILRGYKPDFAFVVEMADEAVSRVANMSFVRWVGPYDPEYKVQPFLRHMADRWQAFQAEAGDSGETVPQLVRVTVQTFTEQDIGEVCDWVARTGGQVMRTSAGELGGLVRADVAPAAVSSLASLGGVEWVEEYVAPTLNNDYAVRGAHLNVTNVWYAYGLTGSNQVIGHADTGLDIGVTNGIHADFSGRVLAAFALGRTNTWRDTHGHGTHTAGSILGGGQMSGGQYKGVAWQAKIVHQSLLDSYGGLGGLPSDLGTLFYQTYTNGARIHSDSWGSSQYGYYSSYSRDTDLFMWLHPDMLVVFSAGNDGVDAASPYGIIDPDCIGSPATAKNLLTVGAAENDRAPGSGGYSSYIWATGSWAYDYPYPPISNDYVSASADGVHQGLAAFSSRGPTDDGRFKPDIVAPGTDVISCKSHAASSTGWGALSNTNYMFDGGTSMACPLMAGASALVREYFTDRRGLASPSAALLKATLLAGAKSLTPGQYGTGSAREIPAAPRPNNAEGWGQANLENALFPTAPRRLSFRDGDAVSTGETNAYTIYISSTNRACFSLAYTDYPASLGAAVALVNDLDLTLVGPGGAAYYPNGGSGADRLNNVEGIDIEAPPAGLYVVRVSGYNVPYGPQPYALVMNGALDFLKLFVRVPAEVAEGDGVLSGAGQVVLTTVQSNDVVVALSSSDATEVSVPPSITIPAGQTNAVFDVTIWDDVDLDGTQLATITASNGVFGLFEAVVAVSDSETATLSVSLPDALTEGDSEAPCRVSVSAPVAADVSVSLRSGDETEVLVPPAVTILSGQTSAVFTATAYDDGQIDGPQSAWVFATVKNWTSGSNLVTVLDNETTNLTLTLPPLVREGQGVLTNAGRVQLSGTLPTSVTVSLASDDVTELAVPASVVIPAGQTGVAFNLTVIDDSEHDGFQRVNVSARAPGLVDGSAETQVSDNDLHQFVWDAVSGPQSAGTPFAVGVTALDITGTAISNYAQVAFLSGSGDGGAVTLAPAASGAFSGGRWTGSLSISTPDTNVRLVASDGAGHSGTSMPFTVVGGPLHHFAWASLATTQTVDAAFPVTVSAKDVVDNTVAEFSGAVALSAFQGGGPRDVLSGSSEWNYPLATYYHDARTQVIYSSGELGGPSVFSSLSLNVTIKPGQTMNAWTIRMKHTPLAGYSAASRSWETNGWTVVVQTNITVASTGWLTLPFSRLFTYNGSSNLLVDFSFNNMYWTSDGTCWSTQVATNRSLYYRTDSNYGDPLLWVGTTPFGYLTNRVPTIRLGGGTPVAIAPTNTGLFLDGVWNGAVMVLEPASNVYLFASDGNLHSGTSGLFAAESLADLSVDLSDSERAGTVGSTLIYRVNLRKTGPSRAGNVRVTDTLPPSVSFVSASGTQGTLTNVNGAVIWTVGTVTGGYASAEIVVAPEFGGQLTNVVDLAANVTDPNLGNNHDSSVATVVGHGVLAVSPEAECRFRGFVGGPFVPTSQIFALTNSGTDTIVWQAVRQADWISLSATGGTLSARASVPVELSLNAAGLQAGEYASSVAFTNLTTADGGAARSVRLTVLSGGLLGTTFASDNGYAGNMFDVCAKKNFGISAFDLNIAPSGQTANVSVYYRSGSSFGRENSCDGWLLFATQTVVAAGADLPTFVDCRGNGVEFLRGTTHGFYIFVDYSSGATMRYTKGSGSYADAVLSLVSNCGKGDPPFTGGTYAARIWNGAVYYDTALVNDLGVSPAGGFVSQGLLGGPFCPATEVYTVSNRGETSLVWSVRCDSNWLAVASSSGVLPAGASTNVVVAISTPAESLGAGGYQAAVSFSNALGGSALSRSALLNVWSRCLTVSLPAAGREAQVFTNGGEVAVGFAAESNLTVRLGATRPDKVRVPLQVVIGPGQSRASFDVILVDDTRADGAQIVTVTADADGLLRGSADILVDDDDAATNAVIGSVFDLERDPGWPREGQWQFGKPSGQGGEAFGGPDPAGGFTGTNVFGVNLLGDYSTVPGGPYALTAGPLDFTGYSNVTVRFRRWLNSDLEPYVRAAVEVSTDGAAWSTVWSNGSTGCYAGAWSAVEYPLPVADRAPRVFVRWSYRVGADAFAASGWNIDDIGFTGIPVSVLRTSRGTPWAWLQSFGLTNVGWEEADILDADGDGLAAWEEYVSDTNPTNGDSVLALLGVTFGPEGAAVRWKGGVSAVQYLERTVLPLSDTNGWVVCFTNLPPTALTNEVADEAGTNSVRFYRVRAVRP